MNKTPNLALVYDFETSGLPLFSEPSDHPNQPHVVQVGAQLVNMDTRIVVQSLDVIVRPVGWTIPDEVAQVHGITTEMAMDLGVPEEAAVEMLLELWKPEMPRMRIGHNTSFDTRIMRIALKRFFGDETADQWTGGATLCTQRLATPIMKLPLTEKQQAAGRRNGYKAPNLREAYEFFTGKPLTGAHNAMVDVDGCKAVFFAIEDGQHQAKAAA